MGLLRFSDDTGCISNTRGQITENTTQLARYPHVLYVKPSKKVYILFLFKLAFFLQIIAGHLRSRSKDATTASLICDSLKVTVSLLSFKKLFSCFHHNDIFANSVLKR